MVERRDDESIRVRLHIRSRAGFRSWIFGYLEHAVGVDPQAGADDWVGPLKALTHGCPLSRAKPATAAC